MSNAYAVTVSNVSPALSVDDIREVFAECGEIVNSFVIGIDATRVFKIEFAEEGKLTCLYS